MFFSMRNSCGVTITGRFVYNVCVFITIVCKMGVMFMVIVLDSDQAIYRTVIQGLTGLLLQSLWYLMGMRRSPGSFSTTSPHSVHQGISGWQGCMLQ